MALVFRVISRNPTYINKVVVSTSKWCCKRSNPIQILASGICYQNNNVEKPLIKTSQLRLFNPLRSCSSLGGNSIDQNPDKPEPKKGLIQRFKDMYRDYWYVVLPVHMTTSAIWFGSFYYAVRR